MAALVEIGHVLGSGIGSLVNIFNPEVVVVGGGFGAAGDLLLEPARERVHREALEPARDLVRIVPAVLGPDAGLVGAGLVAFEALGRLMRIRPARAGEEERLREVACAAKSHWGYEAERVREWAESARLRGKGRVGGGRGGAGRVRDAGRGG